jgi:predicted nucleotidyltransferase
MNLTVPDKEKLQSVSRRNDVSLLGLFGSVARGYAKRKSDVDVMARFSKRKSLLDLVRIEREMSEALGQEVDLLTEASISPHLRDRIFDEMTVLYDDEA